MKFLRGIKKYICPKCNSEYYIKYVDELEKLHEKPYCCLRCGNENVNHRVPVYSINSTVCTIELNNHRSDILPVLIQALEHKLLSIFDLAFINAHDIFYKVRGNRFYVNIILELYKKIK